MRPIPIFFPMGFPWFSHAIEILNAVKLGVDNELRPPDLRDLSSKSFASPVARKKSPDLENKRFEE